MIDLEIFGMGGEFPLGADLPYWEGSSSDLYHKLTDNSAKTHFEARRRMPTGEATPLACNSESFSGPCQPGFRRGYDQGHQQVGHPGFLN